MLKLSFLILNTVFSLNNFAFAVEPADPSCNRELVTNPRSEIITPQVEQELQSQAAALVNQMLVMSADPNITIDFRRTIAGVGKSSEEIFTYYRFNSLLNTTLHDLKNESKPTATEESTDLSALLDKLSAMDAKAGVFQRLRYVRHLPLVGPKLGKFLTAQIVDRLQTARGGITNLIQICDRRADELEDANREIETQIRADDEDLVKLKKDEIFVHSLYDILVAQRANLDSAEAIKNIDACIRLTAERLRTLQRLQSIGESMVAVYLSQIEHNWMSLTSIRRVRNESVPLTIGVSISQAAGAREARARETVKAIDKHNKDMVKKLATDIEARGKALRENETAAAASDQFGLKNLLSAIEREEIAKKEHDRQYQINLERMLKEGEQMVERASSVRRALSINSIYGEPGKLEDHEAPYQIERK